MMSSPTIRVILIDDHEMVTESMSRLLERESDIQVLGSARTSRRALEVVLATAPDVAIVDYRLGDEDGTHTARDILKVSPETKILLLTGMGAGNQMVADAIRVGCVGIMTKDKTVEELVAAVRAVYMGDAHFSTQAISQALARVRSGYFGLGSVLTNREQEILQLMANGSTNRIIASQLGLTFNTVRNHTQKILLKLDSHSKLEAVAVAYREGLITAPV
jgi:DNA-binding NarL/FixJ family response regulator